VAAARRAGSPGAAQCKSSLTTRPLTPDGGGGAAAAHLGDDGVQPERASAMSMMRGGCEHVKGRVASNPHIMNTREHHGRRLSAKNSGRRWTLPALPVGAGGRPHRVGKLVTSSFSWAGSGVLDGGEVGADRRKHWFAANCLMLANGEFTDTVAVGAAAPTPSATAARTSVQKQPRQ
jgi:hypothetical protein